LIYNKCNIHWGWIKRRMRCRKRVNVESASVQCLFWWTDIFKMTFGIFNTLFVTLLLMFCWWCVFNSLIASFILLILCAAALVVDFWKLYFSGRSHFGSSIFFACGTCCLTVEMSVVVRWEASNTEKMLWNCWMQITAIDLILLSSVPVA